MSFKDFSDWLSDNTRENCLWYAKRLSGNDTLANGSHQAGPYIPKELLFEVFPNLNRPEVLNPDVRFEIIIDSHGERREIRAVWYNNRLHGGTRNEARLTNFGGAASILLNPDSTGGLALFVFDRANPAETPACRVWLCRNPSEEDLVEERLGPVEPGKWRLWSPEGLPLLRPAFVERQDCWLNPEEMPPAWLMRFPSGAEIVAKTIELRPADGLSSDARLLRRRECEYQIFQSIEVAAELPTIQRGFNSIDDFLGYAQTILQRRKARSGRSLELHTKTILSEDGLVEELNFSYQPESEPGKSPDFLFPSAIQYRNREFPAQYLRMLAVKTTCKDRWRQILNEADRIAVKHLLTLQEGVSENQFREMKGAGVRLVVPAALHGAYPAAIRPELLTFENFISELRELDRARS